MAAARPKSARGGNPPEHARFKKGQSGNPAGRPPKNRDIRKQVEAELDQMVMISEGGKRVRLTKREIIAKKLVNDAAMGDPKSLANLLKLIAGPSQPEYPVVAVDPADLARFAKRYLSQEQLLGNDKSDAEVPAARHGTK
ncbi:DUF5681 domain-containing protein [Novosphingobium sp. Gsoil 351]|uniref:DUF5681 domain-containing protein n=1 Tax=Novosphingobium sp. Gsoil 351 TaxID=2675225 RepID=UPI0012B46272|nr:DUF5681 domain-containing protein [Novosphingobium sp. Gsoil 351]QGN54979.1 hypothetical protein GKE62_10855 [Novosphingobium sp. Gsoil 351]